VVSVVAVIVLAVWLAVKLAFFGPAVAVAPSGVNPLGVSWKLTAGRFWPVLGRLLLLWAILWGISLVGQIAFQAVVTVAMEAAFGFELDPVTGELLIDGQEASELDVIELDSLIPSSPLLVLLVALTALTQSATQAVTVSATTALYARAGGPGELVA
jgi:hypothetical protein